MMLQAILVFITVAVTDFLWAAYIKTIADNKAFKSSVLSAAIVLAGGFVTIAYINSHWMIVPAMIGAFVGTYLSVSKILIGIINFFRK